MHLYVYYDVPLAETSRVREGIRAMQTRLADECGQVGRLLRRVDDQKPDETWMEIYEQVGDGFEAQLNRAFDESGVRNLLARPRHIERFTDFD